jgi:ribosomal-protein-alanine N-acetyltransferase
MNEPVLRFHRVDSDKERALCAGIMAGSDPWITLGMSLGHLMKTLGDPLNEVYAATVKDEIVGTMVIQTRGAFSGYLKSIAVHPDWRGRKLGEQMMAFIEKEIFSTCANLFLCVSSFNTDARRFYERLGYEKVGVLKDYLVRGHDEILMRKSIAPILENRGW